MKIYINEFHQIKAVYENDTNDDTLTEIEVEEDFLSNYCRTVMKAFCYHKWKDENGNEVLSVYPYKDFSILESIQEQYELNQKLFTQVSEYNLELDYRTSKMELGL